jgi:DNA-binding GntR family transcriptional regulator
MLQRQKAYHRIKREILTGAFQAGAKLAVADLARKLDMGKTPIREALHLLQDQGFVEIIPRAGCFVSVWTVEDVQDIFQLRCIVEGATAELAAQNITEEELRELEEVLGTSYVAGDTETYLQHLKENREFHHRVAVASRNKRLASLVHNLHEQMQALLFLQLDFGTSAVQLMREHEQLVEALRQRDPALARQVMVASIENAREAVLEAILNRGRLPIGKSRYDRQLVAETSP